MGNFPEPETRLAQLERKVELQDARIKELERQQQENAKHDSNTQT
jgi:hypothetical protein